MLNLKVGGTKNPRFEQLIDGSIKPTKFDLDIVVTTPPELFFRNLKNDEFDVFEMSLSEYLITREQAKGDRWDWAALPIFPAKAFVWLGFYVNTGALWFRIFLRELYNIQPHEISWFIGRTQDLSHGGVLGADVKPRGVA